MNIKFRFTAKCYLMSTRLYGVIIWKTVVFRHVTFRNETLFFVVGMKLDTIRGNKLCMYVMKGRILSCEGNTETYPFRFSGVKEKLPTM